MNMPVCLHFGTHKTASTFMQKRFFPSLPGVHYCNCRTEYRRFLNQIINVEDFEFEASKALAEFNSVAELDPALCQVLSDEMFYAPLFYNWYCFRGRGCERLSAVFPGARAAIVFRNQGDLARSMYQMFVRRGGSSSWENFLRHKIPSGYFSYFAYVCKMSELFGKDNVFVYFYEDFLRNPHDYLNRWCDMLGVPRDSWNESIIGKWENRGFAPSLIGIKRFTNRFISSRNQADLLFPRYFGEAVNRLLAAFSSSRL